MDIINITPTELANLTGLPMVDKDTTSTVQAEVYTTWINYAGQTVIEYTNRTITVDGVVAPINGATCWPPHVTECAPGAARPIPLWAVCDEGTDSEAHLCTCDGCEDVWPVELLHYNRRRETNECPLCRASDSVIHKVDIREKPEYDMGCYTGNYYVTAECSGCGWTSDTTSSGFMANAWAAEHEQTA